MIEFQRDIWNWDFPISKHLCQLLDRVFIHVDMTDSNVTSTEMSVRRPEISQVFCRCAARL